MEETTCAEAGRYQEGRENRKALALDELQGGILGCANAAMGIR